MGIKNERLGVLPRLALSLLLFATVPAVHAQAYPQKRILIIVPAAAGGIADNFARIIAMKLQLTWHQPVVVENKTGAAGVIGTDFVAKAPADGYTLVMGYLGSHAVNPSLYKNLPYDPVRDFVPIALVIEAEGLLVVNPAVPAKNVAELIALARAQPGKLSYASGGNGTASHLAGELFKSMAKVDIVHVPYKGNAPALIDLIGGQVDMQFATMPTVLPYVRDGKLRGLAVIGSVRSAQLPQLPTISEAGLPGYSVNNWIGLFAPAGTPQEIVNSLNAEVVKIMESPDVQARMATEGARFAPNSPEQFAQFVRMEGIKWGKIIREAGITPE
jgi:tripartite-type tricarboxylate transporter receptor subunit TctC